MRIRDARGRRHRTKRDRALASPAARGLAQRELHRHGIRLPNAWRMIAMFIVLVVVTGLIMIGLGLDPRYAAFVAIAAVVLLIIVVSTYLRRRHLVAALITARICPICGYDLHGLSVEPDACTVCPECGATWRLAQREPRSVGRAMSE
jgi:lysylphosphatidylglycerol synthetase-like protein (DUF2156 family)